MKFAVSIFFVVALGCVVPSSASEEAGSVEAAVTTLLAGLEAHPSQALVLFQDSLQTNPESRRELFSAALRFLDPDVALLAQVVSLARAEFPDDDALFAEAALETFPDRSGEIRSAFSASADPMETAATDPAVPATGTAESASREFQQLDEEIREAMARAAAKVEGRAWPEQQVPDAPRHYRKSDEIRVARHHRPTDESSLSNHLPMDRQDERAITPGPVKVDDAWHPSDSIRLDESKFAKTAEEATRLPLDAKIKEMSPAGSVGLPKRPPLPRSSVYYIPPAAGSYESTIDQESGAVAPPQLIIQPQPVSPSRPR